MVKLTLGLSMGTIMTQIWAGRIFLVSVAFGTAVVPHLGRRQKPGGSSATSTLLPSQCVMKVVLEVGRRYLRL
jgi:hypothetical protein